MGCTPMELLAFTLAAYVVARVCSRYLRKLDVEATLDDNARIGWVPDGQSSANFGPYCKTTPTLVDEDEYGSASASGNAFVFTFI